MPVTIAGAWIAAGLLLLAGGAKIRRPAAPGRALVLAGLPGGVVAVRLLGAGEVLVAVLALAVGGWAWAPVAVAYGAFAVFVARERARPASSCGCFGEEGVPLTRLHLVVDAVLAVAAAVAAWWQAPGVPDAGEGAWLAVPLVAVATVAVRLLLVDLPRLLDAVQAAEVTS